MLSKKKPGIPQSQRETSRAACPACQQRVPGFFLDSTQLQAILKLDSSSWILRTCVLSKKKPGTLYSPQSTQTLARLMGGPEMCAVQEEAGDPPKQEARERSPRGRGEPRGTAESAERPWRRFARGGAPASRHRERPQRARRDSRRGGARTDSRGTRAFSRAPRDTPA